MNNGEDFILFTMPMCEECQQIKNMLDADQNRTKQRIETIEGEVTVYLLPKDNQPNSEDESEALAEMDYFYNAEIEVPALVTDPNNDPGIIKNPDDIKRALGFEWIGDNPFTYSIMAGDKEPPNN